MALILEDVDASAGIDTTYSMKLGDLFRASLSAPDDLDTIRIEGDNGFYLIYLTKNGKAIRPVGDYLLVVDGEENDVGEFYGPNFAAARLPEGEDLYIQVSGLFERLQKHKNDTYTLTVSSFQEHNGTDGDDKFLGSFFNEEMFGGPGNDKFVGRGGYDRLFGGEGDDRFDGGRGRDFLFGGEGSETFIYGSVADSRRDPQQRDKIFNFEVGDGDRINLRRIDAKGDGGADDAFTFIGDAAFSGAGGEVRFVHNRKGTDTFVYADVDGDGRGEFSIWIDNLTDDLTADEFIL